MDVLVSQGDIALTPAGERIYIDALDEAVQRVGIAASVKKGAFRFQRDLGVDYSGLSFDDPLLREKLELRFQEAAAGITGARIRVSQADPVQMTASVTITACGRERMMEVDLSGKL